MNNDSVFWMTLVAIFGLMVLALPGCSVRDAVVDSSARLVNAYCHAPEVGRAVLRERIGEATAPNRITVTCAGDHADAL